MQTQNNNLSHANISGSGVDNSNATINNQHNHFNIDGSDRVIVEFEYDGLFNIDELYASISEVVGLNKKRYKIKPKTFNDNYISVYFSCIQELTNFIEEAKVKGLSKSKFLKFTDKLANVLDAHERDKNDKLLNSILAFFISAHTIKNNDFFDYLDNHHLDYTFDSYLIPDTIFDFFMLKIEYLKDTGQIDLLLQWDNLFNFIKSEIPR